jgi:hypothetical protein
VSLLKISGSTGSTCSGNSDGIGTYARYNSIAGVAVLIPSSTAIDTALYIADSGNNKIRMVELTSGLYKSVTLDSNIDPSSYLGGLTLYLYSLYACIFGAIVKYSISPTTYLSTSGKTVLSGSYTGTALELHFYSIC